jgi:hypothetical protein
MGGTKLVGGRAVCLDCGGVEIVVGGGGWLCCLAWLGKGSGYFRFGLFLLMELILLHGDSGP